MRSRSEGRLVLWGVAAAALFLATASLLTVVVFPPLRAADERAHVAHGFAITDGRLPTVLDPQQGGPYEYRADRTLYTAHHPPLFPTLTGTVIRAGNEIGDPDDAIRAARLVSVLFGSLAVVATAGLLREVVPDRPSIWVAGAAFVGAVPLLAHISGLVYNDAMALAVSTAVSWAGLRILRLGASTQRIVVLAVLAAVAGLTRISALPIALAAVAVAFVGARRSGAGSRTRAAVVLAPTLAIGVASGWFYARNLAEYGDVSGGDELYDLLDRRPRSLGTLADPAFLRARLSGLWTSREWERGKFGIGPIDSLVEAGITLLVVIGLVAFLVGIVRRSRAIDPVVTAFCLFTASVVLAGFALHVTSGGTPHSRYLFGLLWLVGLAFAVGLSSMRPAVATGSLAALLTASLAVTLITTDQVLRNAQVPIGPWGDLPTFVARSSPTTQVFLAGLVVSAAGAGTVVLLTYSRLREFERSSPRRVAPTTL